MDTLPLETAQRIFELACTDGGATGHALSLVSKDFRAIARKTRFHSVALVASPRRLQAFVTLYEHECDAARGDKPHIRHLHVAFPRIPPPNSRGPSTRGPGRSLSPRRRATTTVADPEPTPSASVAAVSTVSTSTAELIPIPRRLQPLVGEDAPVMLRSRRQPADEDSEEPDPAASPEYLHAAETLFRLATPDLITLAVQCGFSAGGDLVLPAIHSPFPRLRELAFVGISDIRTLLSPQLVAADGAPQPVLFPAVTHLSLAPPGRHWRRDPSLAFWSAAAPRVRHLSVADAEGWAGNLAAAVGVRVRWEPLPRLPPSARRARRPVRESDEPPPPPTWPSVRRLLLQPGPGPIGARCGNAWEYHNAQVEVLTQIQRGAEGAGVDVVLLPAPKVLRCLPDFYVSVRSGWLARVEDEDDAVGCWAAM
ncbi:hypothetical protein C2E23DRAFT_880093 [Lenzites betulinus]|nr:hypothetical protein C2E23DRAFT_880093 [Lenzites betulinus]